MSERKKKEETLAVMGEIGEGGGETFHESARELFGTRITIIDSHKIA